MLIKGFWSSFACNRNKHKCPSRVCSLNHPGSTWRAVGCCPNAPQRMDMWDSQATKAQPDAPKTTMRANPSRHFLRDARLPHRKANNSRRVSASTGGDPELLWLSHHSCKDSERSAFES